MICEANLGHFFIFSAERMGGESREKRTESREQRIENREQIRRRNGDLFQRNKRGTIHFLIEDFDHCFVSHNRCCQSAWMVPRQDEWDEDID